MSKTTMTEQALAQIEARRARCLDNKNQSKLAEASILIASDIPAMAATIRGLWATVAHFESPDDAGICRFCGNLRNVPHGHIQRCYCIPTIRRYRNENDELRQRLAEVEAERDLLRRAVADPEDGTYGSKVYDLDGNYTLLAQNAINRNTADSRAAVLALLDEKAAEWASDAERQTSYQPAIDYTKRDAARELKGLVEKLETKQ